MNGLTATEERRTGAIGTDPGPLSGDSTRQPFAPKRISWYGAMLCRCGLHSGRWGYVTEGECKQLKVCRRCGEPKIRIKHQREWRYVRERDCSQVKECRRCAEGRGLRTKHIWGEAHSSGPDTSARDCERCNQHEEWDTSNDYD